MELRGDKPGLSHEPNLNVPTIVDIGITIPTYPSENGDEEFINIFTDDISTL